MEGDVLRNGFFVGNVQMISKAMPLILDQILEPGAKPGAPRGEWWGDPWTPHEGEEAALPV